MLFAASHHCFRPTTGKNVKIVNKEGVTEGTREAEGIYIRSGIVVIDKGALVPDNTTI